MFPDTIERIPAPPADIFRRRYLETQTPVILTGLFAGQKIAAIHTEHDARELYGWLRIPVATEFLASIEQSGRSEEPSPMRLDEYLDLQRTSPGTHRMCSEQPTPPVMMNSLTLPPYDSFEDAISSFFVGHAGRYAHLHFDGDYRHVLFHQVFGSKRFVFVSPEQNRLIPAIGNFAEWSLENFSPEEMARFLAFTGGVSCTLEAGETLLIPAAAWHFVDYTTTSMSLNLRFGRNAYTRFLAENLHLSKWTQAIAWKMANEATVSAGDLRLYHRLVEATERSYDSAEARYDAMERVLEETADALYGRSRLVSLANPNLLRERYRAGSTAKYRELAARTAREAVAQ